MCRGIHFNKIKPNFFISSNDKQLNQAATQENASLAAANKYTSCMKEKYRWLEH